MNSLTPERLAVLARLAGGEDITIEGPPMTAAWPDGTPEPLDTVVALLHSGHGTFSGAYTVGISDAGRAALEEAINEH